MFKLLRYIDLSGSAEDLTIDTGEVDVLPTAKYLYDEEDPTDKRRRIRFRLYFETELKCRFIADKDTFDTLYAFLNESELVNDLDEGLGLYLWFTDKDGNVHGYPIFNISEQPEADHDSRFFNAEYEFTLNSIYETNPHLPEFLNYGNGNYGDANYGY